MENNITQLDTPLQRVINLDSPIQRGNTTITELVIRPPKKAGHLRGLNTMDIVQMNVDTLIKLLPRITDLTEKEVNDMDPADLLKAGVVVVGFLMGSQQEAYLTA
ncbi:phage tail assembly protein [Aeromonas veronii]